MPEDSVLPERELRARLIRRMEDGRLPVALPTRINAGYGSGAQCDLCDQPIAAHQVEYEINDARAAKVIELRQNPPRGRGVCSGTGAVSP